MKLKSVMLNLTSEECYVIACFLTGALKNCKNDKEAKRYNKNIGILLKHIDPPHFGMYYEVIESIDWDKVDKNKKELEEMIIKTGKKVIKKNPSKGLRHFMNLAKISDKKPE